jgi:hypothetical protein
MLSNNTWKKHLITVMDVFEASEHYSYHDNAHMAPAWYTELGKFFVQVTHNVSAYGPEKVNVPCSTMLTS